LRIRPAQVSKRLTTLSFGRTGETYAVDAGGRMGHREAAFSNEAAKLGLLPSDQEDAIAVLEVRDPGSPLVEGQPLRTPPKTWPLTWAVADVVAGREGVNANGYRNYRGLDVVWRLALDARVERRGRDRDRP
jgi:hypothetical protein